MLLTEVQVMKILTRNLNKFEMRGNSFLKIETLYYHFIYKNTVEDIYLVFSNIGIAVILVYMEVSALRDVASVTCNIIFGESDVMIVLGKLCVWTDFRACMRIT